MSRHQNSPSRVFRDFAFLLVLVMVITAGSAGGQNQKKSKKIPLTSVEAVTDLDAPKDPDDPGVGGGMDASNYFSRKLAPKLVDCTAQVRSAADGWAREYKLSVIKVDDKPGDLLMHMTQDGLQGFFELSYLVKLQQERARVTVFYYSVDGTEYEPAAITKLLKNYDIEKFQDNLTNALLCEGK